MTGSAEPSNVERAMAAAFERASAAGIQPAPQGPLFEPLTMIAAERGLGPLALGTLVETLTTANMARQAEGGPAFEEDDLRLTFSFWEWLFNGAKRR